MRKAYIFLDSGGAGELLRYSMNCVRQAIYYRSETIYLFLEREMLLQERKPFGANIEFKIFDRSDDIEQLRFPRLQLLPYQSWIHNGSEAIVGFHKGMPISYSWLHYCLAPDKFVELKSNQCWTGPSFVHKSMRRKGINTAQKFFQLVNAKQRAEIFVTCVNSNNLPSIKTNLNAGFQKGAVVVRQVGCLTRKRTHLIYLDDGERFIVFNEQLVHDGGI